MLIKRRLTKKGGIGLQNGKESAQLQASRISYALRMFFVGMLVLLVSGFVGMFELLLFLMPVLIAITGVISSLKYAAVVSGVLTAVCILVPSLTISFELMLVLMMIGLLTAYGILHRKRPEEVMLWSAVFSGALVSIWSYNYYRITGEKITATIVRGYEKLFVQNPDLKTQIETLSGMDVHSFVSRTAYLLPTTVLVLTFLLALTTFYLTGRALNFYTRREIFPKFREFRMPGDPVFVAGICAFLLLGTYLSELYPLEMGLTMLYILVFVFYIQGLATLVFGIKMTFSTLLSNLLILGVGLVFPMVVFFIGTIDFAFNLRRKRQREE